MSGKSSTVVLETTNGNAVAREQPNTSCLGDITTRWEHIHSHGAAALLEKNRRNRHFMPSLSMRYVADMEDGLWQTTHEGIAFDEEDNLIDGQHRLQAVVDSGVSVWFLVTRGLPKSAIEVINRGKIRTLAHALQIMGYEHSDHRTIAIARRMFLGPATYCGFEAARSSTKTHTPSDSLMRQFIDKNLEAILFVNQCFKKTRGPAAVAAAMANAYYHADTERLARFPFAMADEIEKEAQLPGDKSARCLRRVIDTGRHLAGAQGSAVMYRKAQNAIRAYLEMVDLTKLCESDEDLFPLPLERMVHRASSERVVPDAP